MKKTHPQGRTIKFLRGNGKGNFPKTFPAQQTALKNVVQVEPWKNVIVSILFYFILDLKILDDLLLIVIFV